MKLRIFRAAGTRVAKAAPTLLRDLLGLLGAAGVLRGVEMVSEPLAWIVGGMAAVLAAILLSLQGTAAKP